LAATLILTAFTAYRAAQIKVKSQMYELLPESADSVQALEELNSRLGSADILLAALMSNDFDTLIPHLPALAAALEKHPDIERVQWRQDVDLIDQNALLIFPTLDELNEYHQDLRQRIRDAVKEKTKLLDEDEDDAADIEPSDEFDTYTFSWAEHERDDGLSQLGRRFREGRGEYREYFFNHQHTTIGLQIFPTQSSGNLKFAQGILKDTQAILEAEIQERLGGLGEDAVVQRVILAGSYRNIVEQSGQVRSDMLSSVWISLGVLALIIMVFFRSIRALFCVLLPVAIGIVWTAGLVEMTLGYVNLITAFIFAILLGLGIDFSIHFFARYREEFASGRSPNDAMVETVLHCGSASILAAVTTSCAFAALSIADFKGFSQFGGVAALGVLLSLLSVCLVLPALVFAIERWMPMKLMGYAVSRSGDGEIPRKPFPLGGRFLLGAVVLGGFSYAQAGNLELELDFGRLMHKETKKAEYRKITYGSTKSSAPAVIFADSFEEAKALYGQLDGLVKSNSPHPIIKDYQALFSLIPEQQEEKKAVIKKICRKLKRKVRLFEGDEREGADEILKRCQPQIFTHEDLPDWIRSKFTDKSGELGQFIFVSPRGSISDGRTALAFREVMYGLEGLDGKRPMVSGKPIVWADVITAMKVDGQKTTIAALITVFLLLLLFERSVLSVLVILLPLILGVGFTIGIMSILGIKLNFFNMLALPTVIGMGVDDGVHIVHRYQELGRGSARYVTRTTGMAAVLTTLTTAVGFGSLLTANIFGLNALGLLTIIGISMALLTTLVVLPAALQWRENRAEHPSVNS